MAAAVAAARWGTRCCTRPMPHFDRRGLSSTTSLAGVRPSSMRNLPASHGLPEEVARRRIGVPIGTSSGRSLIHPLLIRWRHSGDGVGIRRPSPRPRWGSVLRAFLARGRWVAKEDFTSATQATPSPEALNGRKRRGSVTRDRCCGTALGPVPLSGSPAPVSTAI